MQASRPYRTFFTLLIVGLSFPLLLFAVQDESREIFSAQRSKLNHRSMPVCDYAEPIAAVNALSASSGFGGILGAVTGGTRVFIKEPETLVLPRGQYAKVPITPNRMISIGIQQTLREETEQPAAESDHFAGLSQEMGFAPAGQAQWTIELSADVLDMAINQNGVAEASDIKFKDGVVELISGDAETVRKNPSSPRQ